MIEKIKAINNVKRRNLSSKPRIGVEVVVTKQNYRDLPKIAKLLRTLEVDELLVSNLMPVHPAHINQIVYDGSVNMDVIISELESERSPKIILPYFQLKTDRVCLFIEAHATVIRWDGEVSPCYRFLHSYNGWNGLIVDGNTSIEK